MTGETYWLLILLGLALLVLLLARRRIGGLRSRFGRRGAGRTYDEPLRGCGFYYGDPTRRSIRAWDDEPHPPA